ncbi:hypothetical protein Acr_17g0002260 [Actinidia rufa]|uniref:Uncharacterized protein n=1 Tax=Actinidia rufa TaxID=165716 RepID=A0A7J0G1J5_9ERIC|nr:hypothetical protein Acr_17g0002260 [Actinidia rufa]
MRGGRSLDLVEGYGWWWWVKVDEGRRVMDGKRRIAWARQSMVTMMRRFANCYWLRVEAPASCAGLRFRVWFSFQKLDEGEDSLVILKVY